MRGFRFVVVLLVAMALNFAVQAQPQTWPISHSLKAWDGLGQTIPETSIPSPDPAMALKRLGGARTILKVDMDRLRRDLLAEVQDDMRRVLRNARIGYTSLRIVDNNLEFRIRKSDELPLALEALTPTLAQPGMGFDLHDAGDNLIQITPLQDELNLRVRASLRRSIYMLRVRAQGLGLGEPDIKQLDFERIEVLFPGVPAPASDLRSRMALDFSRLSFRLIELENTTQPKDPRSSDTEVLFALATNTPYLVQKRLLLDSHEILDATAIFNPHTGQPEVAVSLSARAARRLEQATKENVGRSFAIALDNEVIGVPVIREPVLQRRFKIEGSFTAQEAGKLAEMLRVGIPEAPLRVVEYQVFAPEQP